MFFYETLFKIHYSIGFVPFDKDSIFGNLKDVRFIRLPKNKWYADPFLLDVTETDFVVLVEEYRYKTHQGRLAKLVIDRKSLKIKAESIISEDSWGHMSFPIFYRDKDKVYVYPENSISGHLNLYLLDEKKNKLSFCQELISAPVVDSVMYKASNNDSFIFTTDVCDKGGMGSVLKVFRKNNKLTYELYQEVEVEYGCARNGGAVLKIGNDYFRVAQDCAISYGRGLVFQKINYDKNSGFSFQTVATINPSANQQGIHTFNVCGDWCVVDAFFVPFPTLRKYYLIFKNFFSAIFCRK